MSPRLAMALENFQRLAMALNYRNSALRLLLNRAFSHDLDRAADAIERIEKDHDRGLAAMAWGFFWIRQGDVHLARNELESARESTKAKTLWGGISLMMLGEIYLELGETKTGQKLIRQGRQMIEEPLS